MIVMFIKNKFYTQMSELHTVSSFFDEPGCVQTLYGATFLVSENEKENQKVFLTESEINKLAEEADVVVSTTNTSIWH